MKTNLTNGHFVLKKWPRMLIIMKIIVLLLVCSINLNATVFSQQKKFDISMKEASITDVFQYLRQVSGYKFIYDSDAVKSLHPVSVNLKNVGIDEVMKDCLKDTKFVHLIEDEMVIIREKKDNFKPAGQMKLVNGKVMDRDGNPLPGVTVILKGTSLGTVTDMNGVFKLEIPETQVIVFVFSFIGMKKQEIAYRGQQEIKVVMETDVAEMDEVVVVGYGTMKKKDLTGSVSSVDERLLEESAATDIGTIIQGQVPGLQILTGSGAPGEEVSMQIRGVASLSGNTSPLIVLDEVPMPPNFSVGSINPADVKSIDVLKGASSAAIYGSRAAAGVIIITTKQGNRNEKPTVDYSYTYGTRQLVSDINVLNTEEFKLLLLEATRNSARDAGNIDLDTYNYYKNFTAPGYFGEVNTPWMKLLMQPAKAQIHNLSVRGGSKSSSYSLAYGLADESGMLVNTSNRRHNLAMNVNTDINTWLKTGMNFRGNISKRGKTEDFKVAAEARPDLPCYNEDGSYYLHKYMYQGEERFETNPMIEAKERDNTIRELSADISAFLEANILDGLKLRLQYAYNYNQRKERDFYPGQTIIGSGGYKGQKGQLTNRENMTVKHELEGRVSYWKKIQKHEFDVTLVGTLSDDETSSYSVTFADFPDDKVQTGIYQGVTFKNQYGYDRGSLLLSAVVRTNYKYNDRYVLTLSWRADGSSRFSPDNRWSYFPSAAAGWIISEEKFFKKNNVVSFLKLRASVGKVGMGYVNEYDWMTLYNSAEYLGKPAVVPGTMGNDDLKWEGTVAYDLGLDFSFLKNRRISGTLGFYKKKTKDLLYNYTLSPGIGLPSTKVNFASIENKGVEFDINFKIFSKRDFSWDFSFNVSKNINKVTGLDSRFVSSPGSPSLRNTVIEEGKSVGLFYGYKTDGVFQNWVDIERCEALNPDMPYQQKFSYDILSPGEIKLLDLSGDGYVNLKSNNYEDQTVLGSSLPDFTGGLSTRLSYKGFTLSMQGSFSYGNMKSWDAEAQQFSFNPSRPKNLLAFALKRWTPDNQINDYPKVKLNGTSYGMTDFWLHDASYLKIQNISLSYRLPRNWLNKTGFLNNAEVFGSINNVYTFTKYPGPNPESYDSSNRIAGAAIDYTAYPQTRTYNIGIKLSIK